MAPARPVVPAVGPFTRAAVLFLGATACGSGGSQPAPVVFYGPAPVEEAGTDAGPGPDAGLVDAAGDSGGLVFYGPAPVPDASSDGETDALATQDGAAHD